MEKLLIICGPTATGKTKLALELAHLYNGELVSADSRQIYKDLDNLTGKDRPKNGPKIWLYDTIDLEEEISVAQYESAAREAIDDIHKRKKLPILVGGTGLYINSVTSPLSLIHVPRNLVLRKKLQNESLEELQREIQILDAQKWEHMNQSDRSNPRRLIRAIEIASQEQEAVPVKHKSFDMLWIGLATDKKILEERIKKRVSERFESAVEEVRALGSTTPQAQSIIGIPILKEYLKRSLSKEEAIDRWAKKEYQYAKRQITWFKKQPEIHWFDIMSPAWFKDVVVLIGSWYTKST